MGCQLIEQGYYKGACETKTFDGKLSPACEVSLKYQAGKYYRLIKSAHLSRPEHYFSIYQSGCNHSCLKCHSAEFSQQAQGKWLSTDEIAELAEEYTKYITVYEPPERATMWHATDLCRCCGACVLYNKRSKLCPNKLTADKILLSPQGFGPARNIVAFTGGDILCRAKFYAEAAYKIKERSPKLWVLLETNGYGLTPYNLDILKEAGVDSFWLDIKAYDEDIYKKLCGTTNRWILKAPEEILRRNMNLEVLVLYIPGWVETTQIERISKLIYSLDPAIPFTILAFFPAYKLQNIRAPILQEMLEAYGAALKVGLQNIKLGNCGVFAKTEADWQLLLKEVGSYAIG